MRRIALAALIMLTTAQVGHSENVQVADILKQTGELMKQRKYTEARELVTAALQNDDKSYNLWLALGYILEADGQYEKALDAFYRARDLKAGLKGLATRIIRLENLLKNAPEKEAGSDSSAAYLARAIYFVESGNIKRGLIEFVKAVDLDRSLIGSQQKLIDLGLKFFSNPTNLFTLEEQTSYLGFYSFFAGNYEDAARELKAYIANYPEGSNVKSARSKLDEITALEEQLKTLKQQPKPIKQTATPPVMKTVQPTVPASSSATVSPSETSYPAENERPSYTPPKTEDKYAGLDPEQLYSEAMSQAKERPLKAIGLLGRALKVDSARPEFFSSLADLYASQKGFEKEAISTYRQIMDKFPGTLAASEAKRKILEMNPSPEQRAREVNEYFLNKH